MLIKMSSRKLNVRGSAVSSHQSYAFCMGRNISLMTGLDHMEKNRKGTRALEKPTPWLAFKRKFRSVGERFMDECSAVPHADRDH